LSWKTLLEEIFCDFTAMRSNDGERFEKNGTFTANGSQASIQEYTYTDIGPEYKFIILKVLKKGQQNKN
jgi:hypothetical protein